MPFVFHQRVARDGVMSSVPPAQELFRGAGQFGSPLGAIYVRSYAKKNFPESSRL